MAPDLSIAQFTVSPDFGPDLIGSWFVFNTWLQRQLGHPIHLELHDSFAAQRAALAAGEVDMIYANPSDAAVLVRSYGFTPVVRPARHPDEVVLAAAADSTIHHVEDLDPGTRLARTDDPDVSMIARIMLEPADLDANNTTTIEFDTYVLVAKALLDGRAEVGAFLDEAFAGLSSLVRAQLRPLVTSQISVIHHALMVGPRLATHRDTLVGVLLGMADDPAGARVLSELGILGWQPMEHEEAEFLIDLMDTLAA